MTVNLKPVEYQYALLERQAIPIASRVDRRANKKPAESGEVRLCPHLTALQHTARLAYRGDAFSLLDFLSLLSEQSKNQAQ